MELDEAVVRTAVGRVIDCAAQEAIERPVDDLGHIYMSVRLARMIAEAVIDAVKEDIAEAAREECRADIFDEGWRAAEESLAS